MKKEFTKVSKALEYLKNSRKALKVSKFQIGVSTVFLTLILGLLIKTGVVIAMSPVVIPAAVVTGVFGAFNVWNIFKSAKIIKNINKVKKPAQEMVELFCYSLSKQGVKIGQQHLIRTANADRSLDKESAVISFTDKLNNPVNVYEKPAAKSGNSLNSFLINYYSYQVFGASNTYNDLDEKHNLLKKLGR